MHTEAACKQLWDDLKDADPCLWTIGGIYSLTADLSRHEPFYPILILEKVHQARTRVLHSVCHGSGNACRGRLPEACNIKNVYALHQVASTYKLSGKYTFPSSLLFFSTLLTTAIMVEQFNQIMLENTKTQDQGKCTNVGYRMP